MSVPFPEKEPVPEDVHNNPPVAFVAAAPMTG